MISGLNAWFPFATWTVWVTGALELVPVDWAEVAADVIVPAAVEVWADATDNAAAMIRRRMLMNTSETW